jgi:ankyrin repeat protein
VWLYKGVNLLHTMRLPMLPPNPVGVRRLSSKVRTPKAAGRGDDMDPLVCAREYMFNPGPRRALCMERCIWAAAAFGDTNSVSELASGTNLDHVHIVNGTTPLVIATHNGHVATVQVLLLHGVHVSTPCAKRGGETALHCAASSHHANSDMLLRTLVEHGADCMAKATDGDIPLHRVVYPGVSKVRSLLSRPPRGGWGCTPLLLSPSNGAGRTPLHCMVLRGDLHAVEVLVKAGASVNVKTSDDDSLAVALVQDRLPHQTTSLSSTATQDKCEREGGCTPLHYAVSLSEHVQPHPIEAMTQLLLVYGLAGIDAATLLGNTPLHYAVIKQNAWAVCVLLTHRADPYVRNKALQTPMSMALEIESGGCVTPDATSIRIIFERLKETFESPGHVNGYDALYGCRSAVGVVGLLELCRGKTP